jgi:hypothetical protein
MKTVNLFFAILTFSVALALNGLSQIYTVTTPISGKMSLGVTDLGGGSTYVNLTFNNLTETVYLDTVGGTVRQAGFVSFTPSPSPTNMVIVESKSGIPAAVTVTLTPPSVLSFDTGPVPITWNSLLSAYTLNGTISGFLGTFNGSYSLVTGGATNSGSFNYAISQPLAPYLLATTFTTISTNSYPESITLTGLTSIAGQGAQAGEYTSTPQIGAEVTAANGFQMQLQPGENNWYGNICEYWFWSASSVSAELTSSVSPVSFILSSTMGVGNEPNNLTASDVNGDGKVDLINVNYADSTISVFTNNGQGGFVSAGIFGVGSYPNNLTAADVNGDGKMDMITANGGDHTLTVLTNNGSSGFVLADTLAVGDWPASVAAADVNGDGKVDLICANFTDGTLMVLTNSGNGGFLLAATLAAGNGACVVTTADVNRDGKPDLICANQNDNTVTVLTNNGSGGFVLSGTYAVGGSPNCVTAADVNGDGKVDLITANKNDGTLTVLTNDGRGGFVFSQAIVDIGGVRSVVAADVNGDGSLDLICVPGLNNSVTVFTNNGSGGFFIGTNFSGPGSYPFVVVSGDVNIDGKPDAMCVNVFGDSITVLTNATPFPPPTVPIITAQPIGQTSTLGAGTTFSVGFRAQGPQLYSYQWQLNGTNLPAATNNPLVLTDLSLSQAGNYDLVIANAAGSVTSSPAMLNLEAPFIVVNFNGQPAAGTVTAVGSATLTISGGYMNGFLFYTLDGSTPDTSSMLYTGPIILTNSAVISVLSLSADFTQTAFSSPVILTIIPGYNLQTSVSGGGSISLNPNNGPFASNSVAILTATASEYWAFEQWTGDVSGNANPLNVTMNRSLNVQAVFVPTAFPLSASTPGGGSVTVNGQSISAGTYYPTGAVVTVTATASNGWNFVGWQGDASGTNNPLSVTVNQTNNIEAVFGTVVGTNAVGGGTIVFSQPNPVLYGTILTASAVPNFGKYFVTWSGAASGTNAPTTIAVTNTNLTINALFTSLPAGEYSLSLVVIGSGSVTVNPQKNYYNAGDTVTLSASTTNAGTSFSGWTGDLFTTNNSITVTMNASHYIQANFGAPLAVSISPTNLAILQGTNAVLNATASGIPPFSYQWQDNEGVIAGATNAIFAINDAQATNADDYSVVVSNPFGSVTSAVVSVTVLFAPAITSQPVPLTVPAGDMATLSVTVFGTTPLSYQWEDSLGSIPNATNSSFSLNPAQTNNWDNYFVIVTNPYGAVTSTVTPLVVYGPVTIASEPLSQVVPLGETASFSVLASGFPAPVYQWTLNGSMILGAMSSTLTITNIDIPNVGDYQALINNGYSTNNSYVVTLNIPPAFVSPFMGATTIWGSGVTLSVGVVGSSPINYQWYFNGAAISGANGATLSFNSIQFTNAGLYSVVISSPYGSITNEAYQVVVNPANIALGFYPGLTIGGVAGYSYVIQSSTNLADTNAWVTLTNLILTQPVELWVDTNVDASSPFNPKTFYKILPGQ